MSRREVPVAHLPLPVKPPPKILNAPFRQYPAGGAALPQRFFQTRATAILGRNAELVSHAP
jgi:hypothetical protein